MQDWLIIVGACAGQIFTAGAIYGAIKADIKNAIFKATDAHESANEAHKRIDNILIKG